MWRIQPAGTTKVGAVETEEMEDDVRVRWQQNRAEALPNATSPKLRSGITGPR